MESLCRRPVVQGIGCKNVKNFRQAKRQSLRQIQHNKNGALRKKKRSFCWNFKRTIAGHFISLQIDKPPRWEGDLGGGCAKGIVVGTMNVTNRKFRLELPKPRLVHRSDRQRHVTLTWEVFVVLETRRGGGRQCSFSNAFWPCTGALDLRSKERFLCSYVQAAPFLSIVTVLEPGRCSKHGLSSHSYNQTNFAKCATSWEVCDSPCMHLSSFEGLSQ